MSVPVPVPALPTASGNGNGNRPPEPPLRAKHRVATQLITGTNPYYESDGVMIYHDDCRRILPLLPNGSVDFVLTDPPYLVNYASRGRERLWRSLGAPPASSSAPWSAPPLSAEERCSHFSPSLPGRVRLRTLRKLARLRHETASLAVTALTRRGVLESTDHGYRLVDLNLQPTDGPVPGSRSPTP